MRFLRVLAAVVFVGIVVAALGVGGVAGITLWHFSRDLPDYQQLVDYVPAVGSKVYAGDGAFLIEFEKEHRIPVTIGQVPRFVIEAFLAAEDRDFYKHNGVNPGAIFRAAMTDLLRFHSGQRPIGASTITQQVVRHFLLTNEVSLTRKIKEMILAYRIDHTLSKDRILEIYLNEIYLGAGSYGVAAAADTYFQKPLDQLSLGEAAVLAALPKAPNNYNPDRHPQAALARRNWVLSGMAEEGWISQAQARSAMQDPLDVRMRSEPDPAQTGAAAGGHDGYFVEEVRRELVARYGEKAVYEGGLSVRTSYVPVYQQMAETAFRNGLVEYDRRHGWRGPLSHLPTGAAAEISLTGIADPPGLGNWLLAAVTSIDYRGATIALKNGGTGRIPLSEMQWARRTSTDQQLGPPVRGVHDVLNPGDIVLVEATGGSAAAETSAPPQQQLRGRHSRAFAYPAAAAAASPSYSLRQIPDVSGGVVVMDPKTGRVLAIVGGWSFRQSQFDRATQAMRQPGSSFKPFVYVTALENGFTPSSTVEDSPVSVPQGPGLPPWQPANYESGYVGATTLEDALVHSRNMATVHVALSIGLKPIARTVEDFGVLDRMPLYYSMVLGSGETTLIRMTAAYSMLDNGGHWLLPSLIDLVQDKNRQILYQKGAGGCASCFVAGGAHKASDESSLYRAAGPADPSSIWQPNATYAEGATLYKSTKPDPLVTPDADYQIVSMMQGVVQRGTGIEVAKVGKPLAGKTGTTSDWFDAWFVGFSPDIAAGVYVGFDDPRTLGQGEVGGHVAAPIFRDFMMAALKNKPATPFPIPAGASPDIASATVIGTAGPGSGVQGDADADADDDAPGGIAANGTSGDMDAPAPDDNPGYGPGAHTYRNAPGYRAAPGSAPGSTAEQQGPGAPPAWRNEVPPSERDDEATGAPSPAPAVRDYAAVPPPAVSRGYGYPAPPSGRGGYDVAGVPAYPTPPPPPPPPWSPAYGGGPAAGAEYGRQPRYGGPAYAPPPGYPAYPPPPSGWAGRPSNGTGGLY